MPEEQKSINWNSVVTNAVSTLVAAVFVGAAAIMWNSATTIGTQITAATNGLEKAQKKLRDTQRDLQASQQTMMEEVAAIHTELRRVRSQLDSHDEILRNRSAANSISSNQPAILPKYQVSEPELKELKEKDLKRIDDVYQKNRIQIQQQQEEPAP